MEGKNVDRNRLGKFTVTENLMLSAVFPLVLAKMRFVPCRAEFLFHRRGCAYEGFSPIFEEVPEFCCALEYTLTVSEIRDASGRVVDVEVTASR